MCHTAGVMASSSVNLETLLENVCFQSPPREAGQLEVCVRSRANTEHESFRRQSPQRAPVRSNSVKPLRRTKSCASGEVRRAKIGSSHGHISKMELRVGPLEGVRSGTIRAPTPSSNLGIEDLNEALVSRSSYVGIHVLTQGKTFFIRS